MPFSPVDIGSHTWGTANNFFSHSQGRHVATLADRLHVHISRSLCICRGEVDGRLQDHSIHMSHKALAAAHQGDVQKVDGMSG